MMTPKAYNKAIKTINKILNNVKTDKQFKKAALCDLKRKLVISSLR